MNQHYLYLEVTDSSGWTYHDHAFQDETAVCRLLENYFESELVLDGEVEKFLFKFTLYGIIFRFSLTLDEAKEHLELYRQWKNFKVGDVHDENP